MSLSKFIAPAVVSMSVVFGTMTGAGAQDQNRRMVPRGTVCPDGSYSGELGLGCSTPQFRNLTDQGINSTTLPQQQRPIVVPSDPLGNAIGNSDPGIGNYNAFGNRGINLPKIE